MPKRKKSSGPSATGSADAAVLKKKTVKQLRAMLKKAGLETTGRKSVLVERLVAGLPRTQSQSQLDVPKDSMPQQLEIRAQNLSEAGNGFCMKISMLVYILLIFESFSSA